MSLESSYVFRAVLCCLLPCPYSPGRCSAFYRLSFYRYRYRNTELFGSLIYIFMERYIESFGSISNTKVYFCFLSRRISEHASSLAAEQIRKLPISHPIVTSSPVTAALPNCESSASRLAVPSRLQRSLFPSRAI